MDDFVIPASTYELQAFGLGKTADYYIGFW